MDNTKCILVFFVNDQKLKVGYFHWLDRDSQKNIDTIINEEEEILIMWPCCEITSSVKTMKKTLKASKSYERVVKVLKRGSKFN